jgi:hypothetical protein
MTFSKWLEYEVKSVKKDYDALPLWLKETFEKKSELEQKRETRRVDFDAVKVEKKQCDRKK